MSEKTVSNRSRGDELTGDGPRGCTLCSLVDSLTRQLVDSSPINSSLANSLLRYWLPPLLWMGVIFVISAQPSLPHYPDTLLDLVLKKTAHTIEYGILAFLLWRALSRAWGALSRPALVVAFVVSVLYAASDEYHQTFVVGRNGTPVDVGVDAVGALVVLLVVRSLGRSRRQGGTP